MITAGTGRVRSRIFGALLSALSASFLALGALASGAGAAPTQSPTTGGSGAAPAVASPVSPTSLEFAPQPPFTTSPPQQVTFTNTTSAPVNVEPSVGPYGFGLSGCPSSTPVLPGQSCVVNVVFQSGYGPETIRATIDFWVNRAVVARVPVTAHVLPIVFTPSGPVDLGSVPDGKTGGTVTVSLRSYWTVATSITSVHTTPGSGFTVTGTTCGGTIASGATCTVSLSYAPGTHVGSATDQLTVTGPWGGPGQETLPLQAVGLAAPVLSASPTSLSFPTPLQVGSSSPPQTVSVTNVGTAPLTVVGNFTLTSNYLFGGTCDGANLSPGQSCQVIVTYRPEGEGVLPRDFRLGLWDIADTSVAVTIPITTGLVLPLFFNPPALNLPPTPVDGVSPPETITVRNFNSVAVRINGYRLPNSPDFEVTDFEGCTGLLASGATCQIVVRAHPTKTGPLKGQLVISGPFYGPVATETVPLSGTGTAGLRLPRPR
jgi:hypothetical protein